MAKKAALEQFHRDAISAVAKRLFMERGTPKTTMDDIAKEAEYSKATLYVYFKNKDEIFHYITLKGMRILHENFTEVLLENISAIDQYIILCEMLAEFYVKYPLYFQSTLGMIASDSESRKQSDILEDIYQIGEILNDDIETLIQKGIQEGVFKDDSSYISTGLVHWAALSGIVSLAENKQGYILQRTGMDKKDFMKFGFQMMLGSILKGSVSIE